RPSGASRTRQRYPSSGTSARRSRKRVSMTRSLRRRASLDRLPETGIAAPGRPAIGPRRRLRAAYAAARQGKSEPRMRERDSSPTVSPSGWKSRLRPPASPVDPAARDLADRLHGFLVARVLEQEAVGAELDRVVDEQGIAAHGDQERAGVREALPEQAEGLPTAERRHAD